MFVNQNFGPRCVKVDFELESGAVSLPVFFTHIWQKYSSPYIGIYQSNYILGTNQDHLKDHFKICPTFDSVK